ncbi:MAG: TetR/AcrR family transcriptional regulator [Pseudomonadota bacterium]
MLKKETSDKRSYQTTEERQSGTIAAVVELCKEQDPATLTTANIAKKIGLSQGALFKHFPSKNRLWESVADWVSEQLIRQVFSQSKGHCRADKALEAMFLAHVGFIARHPGIPRLMLCELQKPGNSPAKTVIRKTLANYRLKVIGLIEQGVNQGRFASNIDTGAAAMLYLGAIQGLVVQAMVNNSVDKLEQLPPQIFSLFKAGIQGATNDEEE